MTPNTIQFSGTGGTWVMRITADRRIEVNEDVDVTEAAQKVLDALQHLLKPAPVQEPVAQDAPEKCRLEDVPAKGGLMPTPPAAQKPWVGLTDEERLTEAERHLGEMHVENCGLNNIKDFAQAIEAKLKEKNHG